MIVELIEPQSAVARRELIAWLGSGKAMRDSGVDRIERTP